MQDTVTPAPSDADTGNCSGTKAEWWEGSGGWRDWGASYYAGSWGNAYNHWSNYNWHKQQSFESYEHESPSEEAKVLNSFLARGSTIDRLSSADLQTVVEEIEKVRSKREAEEKNESGKKPQAAEARKEAATAAGKTPEAPQATTAEATAAGKKPEAPEATEAAADAAPNGSKPAETKEARRKRLHARNMRFYRSFTSPLFAMISGVQSGSAVLQIVAVDCHACTLAVTP